MWYGCEGLLNGNATQIKRLTFFLYKVFKRVAEAYKCTISGIMKKKFPVPSLRLRLGSVLESKLMRIMFKVGRGNPVFEILERKNKLGNFETKISFKKIERNKRMENNGK